MNALIGAFNKQKALVGGAFSDAVKIQLVLPNSLPVDVVAVDGVDVGLHDLIAHGLGDAGGDVAQVVDHAGLEQWV